jgi:predicted short-subunit dehydrogenase-like oxidoreductase (DUF2520 family)
MQFNLIGAGRLGMGLARALIHRAGWELQGLCNTSMASSERAVHQFDLGYAVDQITHLPDAHVTFVTTPDSQLPGVIALLATRTWTKPFHIVVHCSGVYSSALLHPLREQGCIVASVHPFKAFRHIHGDPDIFAGCDCAVDGDETAKDLLTSVFVQLGAKMLSLTAEKKPLYHAAATMASNYLVTLVASATAMLVEAGIPSDDAKQMCERIMAVSLQNVQECEQIADALTGPMLRGDADTIRLHLNAMHCPEIATLYRAAGMATLPLTNHSEEQRQLLASLLMNVQPSKA